MRRLFFLAALLLAPAVSSATGTFVFYDGSALHKRGKQTMDGPLTIGAGSPAPVLTLSCDDVNPCLSVTNSGSMPAIGITSGFVDLGPEASLQGSVTPTAGVDTAIVLTSKSTLAAPDKLASVRNNGVEKAYVLGDGGAYFSGSVQAAGDVTASNVYVVGSEVKNTASALLKLWGSTVNGATAVSVAIDSPAYSTAGAKLLSVRNNGAPKFEVYYDGAVGVTGGSLTTSASTFAINHANAGFTFGTGTVTANAAALFTTSADAGTTIKGNKSDGASVVAVVVDNGATLANATAKVLSVRNNGTEKMALTPSTHVIYTGTAPGVATGAGDCGTSPSVAGNDSVGRVTVGSSTNGGKCTLTFSAA
jgi:hypothetical protein